MPLSPQSSGLLRGGGLRHPRRRNFKNPAWENIHLNDWSRIRKEVPNFDPDVEYTDRQLQLVTEKMLIEDAKPFDEYPMVLLAPHWLERIKREIYVSSGIPDPSVVSGMYWRSHPQGRKMTENFHDREDKRKAFYK